MLHRTTHPKPTAQVYSRPIHHTPVNSKSKPGNQPFSGLLRTVRFARSNACLSCPILRSARFDYFLINCDVSEMSVEFSSTYIITLVTGGCQIPTKPVYMRFTRGCRSKPFVTKNGQLLQKSFRLTRLSLLFSVIFTNQNRLSWNVVYIYRWWFQFSVFSFQSPSVDK